MVGVTVYQSVLTAGRQFSVAETVDINVYQSFLTAGRQFSILSFKVRSVQSQVKVGSFRFLRQMASLSIKVYINNLGHMTKMAAMPIYGKNPSKIFFSRTGWPISTKLGMKHRWLKHYNVYINHDPVMTLTYFTARST